MPGQRKIEPRWHTGCGVQAIVSQLSQAAVNFLIDQFHTRVHMGMRKQKTLDGRLPLELLTEDSGTESFFHCAPPATSPTQHCLGVQTIQELMLEGSDEGRLTLDAYLGLWAYCTLLDARKAVIAMLYLGYPDTYAAMTRDRYECALSHNCMLCCCHCILMLQRNQASGQNLLHGQARCAVGTC